MPAPGSSPEGPPKYGKGFGRAQGRGRATAKGLLSGQGLSGGIMARQRSRARQLRLSRSKNGRRVIGGITRNILGASSTSFGANTL